MRTDSVAPLGWLGAALMLGVFVAVLGHFVDVVAAPGQTGPLRFYGVVAAGLLAGTVLARVVSVRVAVPIAAVLFVGGLWWYLQSIDAGAIDPVAQAAYVAAMLAGQSVLDIQSLEYWILGVTPAPVFLGWYLAVRGRYVGSALVGTLAVGTLVLTGDAGPEMTLLAAIGGLCLFAAATIDRSAGTLEDARPVATVIGVVVIATLSATVVPATGAYAYGTATGLQDRTGSATGTLDGGLHPGGDSLSVRGSVSLSPKVLFSVSSERAGYWRTGAYDTYTGDGWIRRSDTAERPLTAPVGPSEEVTQRYRMHREMGVMPALWRPTNVSDARSDVLTDGRGGLVPREPLRAGDSYAVSSAVPSASNEQLQAADGPAPATVRENALQVPDSLPDRVGDRTAQISANADNPYETAVAIERYLESTKGYSLSVSRPQGNVADAFLFEMDEGYCVYFATTMAVMLRTQDVPARMATGYSTGQRVDSDEWIVRGQNAHAWVEVYLEDVGWVRFDPTPAQPREDATNQRLETAREDEETAVDVNDSNEGEWTPSDERTTESTTEDDPDGTVTPVPGQLIGETYEPGGPNLTTTTTTTTTTTPGEDDEREPWWLWLIGLGGLAAGARQSGLAGGTYRLIWLVHQPRADPASDVERAFERTMAMLAAGHRPRGPAEPVSAYLEAVDASDPAREVAAIRERARYGSVPTREEADRARAAADTVRRAADRRTVLGAAFQPVLAALPWSPDSV